MSTNFNQILDEIQQQKLQVAALIDDNNAEILQSQQELNALSDQLAGLALLEQRTQELADNTNSELASDHDINLNIHVTATQSSPTADPTVTTATTDTQRVIFSNSTEVPGQATVTSPVIGVPRVKTVRHG